MRTQLTENNPYGASRHGFAWQHVPEGIEALLDFGCHNGRFLSNLSPKGIGQLVGVDRSRERVAEAHDQHPDLDIRHLDQTVPLPFDDGQFNCITLLDVLEHIDVQPELIREFHRILAPGGTIIITVPKRHFFSPLDFGNLKFVFPRMHKYWYCRVHSPEMYEYRYEHNPDGLVGDIAAAKHWHEHFTPAKMRRLLTQGGFRMTELDGSGFFTRPIYGLRLALRKWSRINKILLHLQNRDAVRFQSMNLFCVAHKTPAACDTTSRLHPSQACECKKVPQMATPHGGPT